MNFDNNICVKGDTIFIAHLFETPHKTRKNDMKPLNERLYLRRKNIPYRKCDVIRSNFVVNLFAEIGLNGQLNTSFFKNLFYSKLLPGENNEDSTIAVTDIRRFEFRHHAYTPVLFRPTQTHHANISV